MTNVLPDRNGEDVAALFAALADAPAVVLAVSGGPDSMALLNLAARWAAARDAAPALHVATVDHGLRPQARQEADRVAAAAAALDLSHATLTWAGAKPATRIQEKARAARYDLLATHARAVDATHIVTAHHADDQAETVLLRLGRGSGIGGLAGMRALSPLASGLWLARPLLGLRKADLVTFCRDNAIDFIDDTSNQDPAFARTRVRAQADALAGLGLDTACLARLADRMARADTALGAETDRTEAALRPDRAPGSYVIALAGTRELAPEIALRLLHRAVAHVSGDGRLSGNARQLRLDRLEALQEALWTALASGRTLRATLAGTLVRLDANGVLHVSPEPARRRGRLRSRHPDRPD